MRFAIVYSALLISKAMGDILTEDQSELAVLILIAFLLMDLVEFLLVVKDKL